MRADEVEIGRPCPIDLRERMASAAGEFHCDHCDRPVHVLSHLSEEQAAAVLARRQREDLCVAFLRAPDGSVHFRSEDGVLVPAARLRRMVRASALALSVAACSASEQTSSVTQPPSVTPPLERDASYYQVLAGAREREDVEKVDFESLQPLRTPRPTFKQLQAVRGDGPPRRRVTIRYCVDEKGRVFDPERVSGDEQLARLVIERMARWRFAPYEVRGFATRVCTKQIIDVDFEADPPPV